MDIKKTKFEGVYILTPQIYRDSRGCFFESFNRERFAIKTGANPNFIQDNVSHSTKGVLRGLHYQLPPHSQAKLVSVLKGSVMDCIVDLRPHSKTFGESHSFQLSAENNNQLYIPKGFAHGFYCEKACIMHYKVEGRYNPKVERTLSFEVLHFWEEFAEGRKFTLSEKDLAGINWKECVKELSDLRRDSKQMSITYGL